MGYLHFSKDLWRGGNLQHLKNKFPTEKNTGKRQALDGGEVLINTPTTKLDLQQTICLLVRLAIDYQLQNLLKEVH